MASRRHVVIIGAGPAGLMAAEKLSAKGYSVTIYDRMASPARKFLMAGRGGLNLTHSEPLPQFLARYGAAQEWLAPMIEAFPPDALRAWCEGLGEETYVGSSGRVFPTRMKASGLLRAWLRRLDAQGVYFVPHHTWYGWQGNALRFMNANRAFVEVDADAVLLALGGASWPRLGSDGGWTTLLNVRGVEVEPLRPTNCGFTAAWSEYFRSRFAGQPLKPVAISHGSVRRQGEAMVTQEGVEGGIIYALSGQLREAIATEGSAEILLDMRPAMTEEALTAKLSKIARASKSFTHYMRSAGFSPLVVSLLREALGEQAQHLSPPLLAQAIKSIPLRLTGIAGMARAISSAGGVTQSSVDTQLMLHALPGVFVAGEMLDWEAPTGGYLLQACFSTAIRAAEGIDTYLENMNAL